MTTVTIACDVSQPDGTEFATARLEFALSGPDYDTAAGEAIPAVTTYVDLDASGVGTADLWPVDLGTRNTFYAVVLRGSVARDGRTSEFVSTLGRIQPQSSGGQDLADLLAQSSGGIVVGSTIYETLADAVAAAVAAGAAGADPVAALAAKEAAEAAANQAELDRAAAELAAQQSAASAPWNYPTLPDLLAETDVWADGSTQRVRDGADWFVDDDAVTPDKTAANGKKLIMLPSPMSAYIARQYDLHPSNSGSVNYACIQLLLDRSYDLSVGGVFIHPGSYTISGRIFVPYMRYLKGSAWGASLLNFDTADGGVDYTSGSVIEDLDLRGTGVANVGFSNIDAMNRASARRLRIQDFTDAGCAIGMEYQANNSTFEDIQVKFCPINFALGYCLNMRLLNPNSDQLSAAEGGSVDHRGIKAYTLSGSSPNDMTRNTEIVGGGIIERGIGDHQVEIERSLSLLMQGVEFNGASISSIKNDGDLRLISPHFTSVRGVTTTNKCITGGGTTEIVGGYSVSGQLGASPVDLFEGDVRFDGSGLVPLVAGLVGAAGASGTGFVTSKTSAALVMGATTAGTSNRVELSINGAGITATGVLRVYEVEIVVAAITGAPDVHLALADAPYRVFLGSLALGVNRFTVLSSVRQQYAGLQFLSGSGEWTATILSRKVMAR